MHKRSPLQLSKRQIDKQFEYMMDQAGFEHDPMEIEFVANDVRVGWLVGFTHLGATDHVRDVSEYMELTAQIADSHGVDPDIMHAAIAYREDLDLYEQA